MNQILNTAVNWIFKIHILFVSIVEYVSMQDHNTF